MNLVNSCIEFILWIFQCNIAIFIYIIAYFTTTVLFVFMEGIVFIKKEWVKLISSFFMMPLVLSIVAFLFSLMYQYLLFPVIALIVTLITSPL